MFATVWHAEAFIQESVLDVTLRVRYNMAKVCNMTRFYSERSYRKIVHDNLVLGRTKGTFTSTDRVIGKLLMWEIKLFHKTTYRKLPTLLSCREYCSSSSLASVKRKRNIEVNTCNLSVWSRILQYCAKVMQTIIDEKSVCSDLSRFYRRCISETSHGYDKSARYRSSETPLHVFATISRKTNERSLQRSSL